MSQFHTSLKVLPLPMFHFDGKRCKMCPSTSVVSVLSKMGIDLGRDLLNARVDDH